MRSLFSLYSRKRETIHSTYSTKDRRGVGSFRLTSENYLYAIRRYVNNWVSKPQNKQTAGVLWQWYFNISSPLENGKVNLVQPTTLERQANTQYKTAIVHKMPDTIKYKMHPKDVKIGVGDGNVQVRIDKYNESMWWFQPQGLAITLFQLVFANYSLPPNPCKCNTWLNSLLTALEVEFQAIISVCGLRKSRWFLYNLSSTSWGEYLLS